MGTNLDIVISDLSMPGEDGFAVLKAAHNQQPGTPVIILTGAGGVPDSVQAMRAGAFDFLTKPFHPAREGRSRQDLFFRLNVVPIHVPPLRERLEDVPDLGIHFLERAARRLGRNITLSDKATAVLQNYSWPGNVRELENLIERMAILDRDGVVDLDDIPPTLGGETGQAVASTLWDLTVNGIDFATAVERFERALIGTAMRHAGNNKSKAAAMLGMARTTLVDKMRKLGL